MFTFMYGNSPRPMQAPSGYYTIEGDTITASTTNFGIVFYFEIIDSKTVKFTGANMEMGTELEALFSGTAQIGDVFYWTEPLPED